MNRPGWDWHPLKGSLCAHWSVSVNSDWCLNFWLARQAAKASRALSGIRTLKLRPA
jgi:plasmid maintenance system killer protein